MNDIYATPAADVTPRVSGTRAGGNVEDAIEGNIDVRILETMGEAWRGMKGFKLKCHLATVIWFLVYIVAVLVIFPVMLGLAAIGADETTAAIVGQVLQFVAISATMPMIVGITIMGIRHSQGKAISAGSIFNMVTTMARWTTSPTSATAVTTGIATIAVTMTRAMRPS